MPSFKDAQFPPQISAGALGGPEFMTEVVTTGSGDEQRNQRWAAPRWRYNVATGVKQQADADIFFAFILSVGVGQAYSFPFKDWADFTSTGDVVATGDGATTAFNLVKTYTYGAYSFARRIKLPIASTLVVYNAGVQTLDYTLSARGDGGGVITFGAPPANGAVITADYEFDVPVRFATDLVQGNVFTSTLLLNFENIDLIEVRSLA